jgi:cell division protein FtsN
VNAEPPPAAPNAALEATASNTGPVDQARAEPDAASEPTPPKSGSADQVSAKPADQASAAPAKTIADLISADAGTGGVWLQLAALPDEASANVEWTRITKKHGAALGATQPSFERAELGARGVWYRVRIGPFANRADARAACKTLAARGQACRIAQP